MSNAIDRFSPDKQYLNLCKSLIEKKMAWGDSKDWSNQDFLALSEKILEVTDVQLSGTTLKRVWGKVKYDSIPHTNTLNTLVRFVGYESWLSFKATHTEKNTSNLLPTSKEIDQKPKVKRTALRIVMTSLIIIICLSIISFIYRDQENNFSTTAIEKTIFTSKPVAKGIPNTVVFNYDVSPLPATEFMIQQYWDVSKRFRIESDHHAATSIYYYPGYWRAKLVADNQIIKQHDLHIKSEGWLATLGKSANVPEPRYLLGDELVKDSILKVADKVEQELETFIDAPPILTFHNVREFDQLDGDNMIFETTVRNTYTEGNGICQQSQLIILGSKGPIIIPLAIPGCTSELGLLFNDIYQDGKKYDLSAFGVDFSKWQKIRLVNKNKQAVIYLNDQLIYELDYRESIGLVSGLRFRFSGNGEVKYVKLWDSQQQAVFQDYFLPSTSTSK